MIFVIEALPKEFRDSYLWELLYADKLAILSDTLEDITNGLAVWKTSLESHGLRGNINKIKILITSAEHSKIS